MGKQIGQSVSSATRTSMGGYQEAEVDFVADNPGLTLFHCTSNCTWTTVS